MRAVYYERLWKQDHYNEDFGLDQQADVYRKPWHRFGAYGVGLILGSLLFINKEKRYKECMM